MNWRRVAGAVASWAVIVLAAPALAYGEVIEPDAFTDGIATNNNCTLREAVQAANENIPIDDCPAGSGTETDRIFLDAGHYKLTIPGHEDSNLMGDLDADVSTTSGPLFIRGAGMAATFIDAEMDDRVIEKPFSGDLTLWDLTLDGNGYQDILGGGVFRASGFGETIVDHVTFQGGDAQFGGGVQCSFCTLEMTDSIIRENQATVTSVGFPNVAAQGGGMVISAGEATIARTAILGNEAIADDSAEGGGLAASGDVRISNSTIAGNAVFSSTDSSAASSVRGAAWDLAHLDGTNVKIVNSTISQNAASETGHDSLGGGVHLDDDGKVTIVASTLGNNNASVGTALSAQAGKMTLRGSILDAVPRGPDLRRRWRQDQDSRGQHPRDHPRHLPGRQELTPRQGRRPAPRRSRPGQRGPDDYLTLLDDDSPASRLRAP